MVSEKNKSILNVIAILGVVAIAVCVIALIQFAKPWAEMSIVKIEQSRNEKSMRHLKRAISLSEMPTKQDQAFRYFQIAIKSADTRSDKIAAVLATAEFLGDLSEKQTQPYSLMARQYFDAVLDMSSATNVLSRAYQGLFKVAVVAKDLELAEVSANALVKMVKDEGVLTHLMLKRISLCLDVGSWRDMVRVLDDIKECGIDLQAKKKFILLREQVNERILIDDQWFNEWVETSGFDDPNVARVDLETKTLESFERLSHDDDDMIAGESIFSCARIHYNKGQSSEALDHLYSLLALELGIHEADILLIMAAIAREGHKSAKAAEMMLMFLKRFHWNTLAADEFSAVVEAFVDEGNFDAALEMLDKYLCLPLASSRRPELLYRAGVLAAMIPDADRASGYFDEILKLDSPDDIVAKTLFSYVDLCMNNGDLDGASRYLVRYVNRFSYAPDYGRALFQLFDVQMKRHVSPAEIINMAVLAADGMPKDEKALVALLTVAEKLEEIGLPALAQAQYNKIVLLYYVGADKESVLQEATGDSMLVRALIGNARCSLSLGKSLVAERIFRDLCNNLEQGEVQSESALLWALMAIDRGQNMEARRRLQLVDEKKSTPIIAARVAFEKLLLNVDFVDPSAETLKGFFARIKDLEASNRGEDVRRIYMAIFESLRKKDSYEEMRALFARAVKSPYADLLPLTEFNLILANSALKLNGVAGFVDCMEYNDRLITESGKEVDAEDRFLVEVGKSIKEHGELVEKQL